jgi:hypothetical protein
MWAPLIDAGAMIAGMWYPVEPVVDTASGPFLAQHLTMLSGMTVGMLPGMWMAKRALSSSTVLQTAHCRRPWGRQSIAG